MDTLPQSQNIEVMDEQDEPDQPAPKQLTYDIKFTLCIYDKSNVRILLTVSTTPDNQW